MKKTIKIIATIILTILAGLIYAGLELAFYDDFGCGCSSTCTGYYPVMTSRLIGYFMLMASTALFIAGIWRYKGLSKWWTIPAVIVIGIACYGNGYMIFNKGVCGNSINQTTFFINQTKLGDYAKADRETIDLDSLKAGKLNGKLLGYALSGKELTVFRIAAPPLQVRTSFWLWKIRSNVLVDDLSYGLNVFRNFEAGKIDGHYEFIGGQGMTEKDFLAEFVLTEKEMASKELKNKQIIHASDGTTRFLFEME